MKNKRGLLGTIILVITLVVVGFFWFVNNYDSEFPGEEEGNFSCVPDACCHAEGCVLEEDAPDCSDVSCTQECVPGTLDCGQGECAYINGSCEVVWDEE